MLAKACLRSFTKDESGATAIEYGLIAGIISIAIVFSLTSVRAQLDDTFTGIAAAFADILK